MDSLCRLCLVHAPRGVNLFRGVHSKKYSNQLKKLFRIRLHNSPKWPLTACRDCVKKLNDIEEFQATITASEEKLYELLTDVRIECETIEVIEIDTKKMQPHGVPGSGQLTPDEVIIEEEDPSSNKPLDDDDVYLEKFPEDADPEHGDIIEEEGSSEEIPLDGICFEDLSEDEVMNINEEVIKSKAVISNEEMSGGDHETDSTGINEHPDFPPEPRVRGRIVQVDYELEQMLRDMSHLKCEPCLMEFKCYYELNNHHRIVHARPFGHINCCGYQLNARPEAYDHMKYHMDKNAFKCGECGKCCLWGSQLRRHQKKGHKEIMVEFKCKICGKDMKSQVHLNQHLQSHLGPEQRPFKCTRCDERFIYQRDRQSHMHLVHKQKKTPGRTECDICGTMVSRMHINAHKRWNHPETNEKKTCSVCGKKMLSELSLKYHMKNNHRGEMFPCETCGKEFKTKSNLQRHIDSMHLGIVYYCPHCPYSTRFIDAFKTHNKTEHREEVGSKT